jgi:hypothetical protein
MTPEEAKAPGPARKRSNQRNAAGKRAKRVTSSSVSSKAQSLIRSKPMSRKSSWLGTGLGVGG